jgi:hypothetical protein
VIEALIEVARKLVPAALSELVHLARLALEGAPQDDLIASVKRLSYLQAFKASYRRPGR